MSLQNINPTSTKAWKELEKHYQETKNVTIQEWFEEDASRAEKFHIKWGKFLVDYSKNRINQTTLDLLINLANEIGLKEAIYSQFSGEKINKTEDRAVLHTALRLAEKESLLVNGKDISLDVFEVKNKIKTFSENIIIGKLKGFSGKPFTDIVNIGIGGSDLGPAMVVEALEYYKNHLNVHFISNIDGDYVQETIKKLNPETTLFVIVSKSFATQETLVNSQTIRSWFLQHASQEEVSKHFVAVSSNIKNATEFGISENNIFPMWDWVGGRFSLWSAVGLTISIAIGFENFDKLLLGANEMDTHFKEESFDQNIPVILGLLSIWYNNFYGAESEAIIPYTQYLQKLAPYLQQAIMESNGKSIDRTGKKIEYQTGTIVWGEPGTNSQHAFFQLIHQGTKLIPADFIGFIKPLSTENNQHNQLMSNFFAQTEALLLGKTINQVESEFEKEGTLEESEKFLSPFKVFEGNKPTNTLLINSLTPETLGSLIAMYEHKIFVQGVIWNIFSYDQWGVELGKQLASSILDQINANDIKNHDVSTKLLLDYYMKNR